MRLKSRLLGAVGIVVVACSLVLLAGNAVSGQSQDSRVAQILEKAGAYVGNFERQLTGIVSEETYLQVSGALRRELKSDLLLVPVAGEAHYVEFRDVFEVDGRPVRDRGDRLTRLFLDPSASASAQLRAIAEESARYNIGNLQRTVNIPTLALVFLRAENQATVTFTFTNRTTPALMAMCCVGVDGDAVTKAQSADFGAMPAGTRVVAFKEARKNTLIRSASNTPTAMVRLS